MIDYSNWERKEFNVTSLQLDPLNPRVSSTRQGEINQLELIHFFVRTYNVYSLAESIARNGYFPDEVIIIFRKDETHRYVLEGNRRVAALKLLLNPENAPDKDKKKFRILSDQVNKPLIQKVQVVVAPSRESATPIIIEKHTHTPVKPWSVLMEATYIQNILKGIDDPSSMLGQYGISADEFDRFRKMNIMYDLASCLNLPDHVLDKLQNKEAFPMTTVERIYNSPQIREVLGLSDNFEDIADLETFKTVYSIIITDISEKNEDSRSLDSKDDRQRYASALRTKVPLQKKCKSAKVSEVIKNSVGAIQREPKTDKKEKPRPTKKSKGVIPKSFIYSLDHGESLKKLCHQLKELPVDQFADVAAISFRIFLEKSIKIFLKSRGVNRIPATPTPPRQVTSGQVKLSDAQLGPLLDYLGKRDVQLIDDENVKKNIRIFKSGREDVFPSLMALNSIIHNEELSFSEEQVRILWPSLERLFMMMLSEEGRNDGQLQDTPKISRRKTGTP